MRDYNDLLEQYKEDKAELQRMLDTQEIDEDIFTNNALWNHLVQGETNAAFVEHLVKTKGADPTGVNAINYLTNDSVSDSDKELLVSLGASTAFRDALKKDILTYQLRDHIDDINWLRDRDENEGKRYPSNHSYDMELIRELVKNGADINGYYHAHHQPRPDSDQDYSNEGYQPITVALRDETLLADLIERDGLSPDAADSFGRTGLHYPDEDRIAFLISYGADVNHRDEDGLTPEEYYEINNPEDIYFKELIGRGEELAENRYLDAQHDMEEEKERALEKVENQKRAVLETAIDVAREQKSRDFNVGFELIKGVMASGISASDGYRDHDPYSAAENVLGDAYVIAVAELQNSESTVRLMLENGASVRASGSSGTLLHHATTPEFIDHLMEKGFNARYDENEFGKTAMDAAIENDRLAVAEKLVEIGLTVDSDRRLSAAQLHHAESAEMAQFMIDNGANVNHQDIYGQTALHKLARSMDHSDTMKQTEVAACLLKNGADPAIRDQTGKTMLDCFSKNGQRERMQMIVQENEKHLPAISKQREHERDHSPSFSR